MLSPAAVPGIVSPAAAGAGAGAADVALEAPAICGLTALVMSAGTPSSSTLTVLPSVFIEYGTTCTRFITTRVRPSASTAATLSTLPTPICWERTGTFRVVPGKSSATRAGLSIVKLNGSAASGSDSSISTCTRSPGSEV